MRKILLFFVFVIAGTAVAADWGTVSSGTTNRLNDVEYIDGLFVACGDGTVLTSTNGLDWSAETVHVYDESYMENVVVTADLHCIGHVYGSLCALDGSGMYYSRSSGVWNGDAYQTETFPFNDLIDVSWMAFAAGSDGNVYLSESDFQSVYSGSSALYGIATDDGGESSVQCVAVGADGTIVYSYDGYNWNQSSVSFSGSLRDVAFGGYQFAAVGDGGGILVTETDLDYWSAVSSSATETLYGVATDGTNWLAVGAGGTMLVSSNSPSAWSTETSPVSTSLNAVCYGNGRFVAVGDNGAIVTTGVGGEEPGSTPVVTGLTASPNPFFDADSITLTATASSTEVLGGAEYFLDAPGVDGAGTAVAAADGAFDETEENLTTTLDVSGWAEDEMHMVYVHAQDQLGEWSDYVQVNVRQGASFVVPRDYATIQAAVDAAQAGDVIQVQAGTYAERLLIDKSLVLASIDGTSVVIDVGGDGNYGICVTGDDVCLSGLRVVNCEGDGIYVNGAARCRIEQCVVSGVEGYTGIDNGSNGYGIYLLNAEDCLIDGVTVSNVIGGLDNHVLYSTRMAGCGVGVKNSSGTVVSNSTFVDLRGMGPCGINASAGSPLVVADCEFREIQGDSGQAVYDAFGGEGTSGGNAYGIYLGACPDVRISGCSFSGISGGPGGVADNGLWFDYGSHGWGYGIWSSDSTTILSRSMFDVAATYGVDVYLNGDSDSTIGGAEDNANGFRETGSGICIYNNTANAVDATHNVWLASQPDSVIHDQLDDAALGRVDSSFPVSDNPPAITSETVARAYANYAYSYSVSATDTDGDAIQIQAGLLDGSALPSWLSFADHVDGTATLSGTPPESVIGTNYAVKVVASSGVARQESIQQFILHVQKNLYFATTPQETVAEETVPWSYTVQTKAGVADGDIMLSVLQKPDWLGITDNGDGTAVLSGTADAASPRQSTIEIQAQNGSETVTQTFDLTVVQHVQSQGRWYGGELLDLDLQGRYAYAVGLDGMYVLDVNDPLAPQETAHLSGAGGDNIAVDGSRAAVSHNAVFGIIDVSSPTNPVLLKAYSLGSNIVQLRYDDDKVYVITDSTWLYIIDVQDPQSASVLYSGYMGSGAQWSVLDDMDVDGDLLGIVDGYDMGLHLWDVSDPVNPVSAGEEFAMWGGHPRIDIASGTVHMTRQGEYAVYGSDTTVALPDLCEPIKLKAVGDLVYVASTNGGLKAIRSDAVAYSYPDTDFGIHALSANSNVVALATEYGLCTLPAFGTATPRVTCSLALDLSLSFGPCTNGTTYTCEWCTNLAEGVWMPFSGSITTNGTTCSVTLPDSEPFNSSPAVYLRVKEE